MSKSQRTKGASGERDVCNLIKEHLGVEVKRNLNQTREGGADIKMPPFSIEVKRRARIALYDWMTQAYCGCDYDDEIPLVVCRGDHKEWLAVMPFYDFLQLLKKVKE